MRGALCDEFGGVFPVVGAGGLTFGDCTEPQGRFGVRGTVDELEAVLAGSAGFAWPVGAGAPVAKLA